MMRVTFAIDETAKAAHTSNVMDCLKWAQERTGATGRPIKLVECRGGEKYGKTVAEVSGTTIRPISNGSRWPRKKLESLHVV